MKLTLYAIAAALALAFVTPAQEAARRGVAPREKFDHKVRFTTSYDKFEDETTVRVDPRMGEMRVARGLEMTALFRFKGERLAAPVESATLRFESLSHEWRFLYNQDLIALIDGERVTLGTGEKTARVRGFDSLDRKVMVRERLYFVVDYGTLRRIAGAKAVEMKLGNKPFKVKDRQLEVLRDFVGRMRPAN